MADNLAPPCLSSASQRLTTTPPGLEPSLEDRKALGDDMRQDIELKVAQKVEEMWEKGKQVLNRVQQKQKEKADFVASEIEQCLQRQIALERENEHLKQILATLTSRLNIIGMSMSGALTPGCSASPGPTSVGPSSLASATPSESLTPNRSSSAAGEFQPFFLPEVPDFPFPTPTASSLPSAVKAKPLLLSQALLPPTAPAMLTPAVSSSGSFAVFNFTLRKADDTELGLDVKPDYEKQVLVVESIRPGAIEAWNRQCVGNSCPDKIVRPGDRITSVNGLSNQPDKMLEECWTRQLLRLAILRGEATLLEAATELDLLPATPMDVSSRSQGATLRADASEFIPSKASLHSFI